MYKIIKGYQSVFKIEIDFMVWDLASDLVECAWWIDYFAILHIDPGSEYSRLVTVEDGGFNHLTQW